MSDIHAGMTLGEIAAQAATCGECELTKFALSCIRFVVHPSADFNPSRSWYLFIDPERMIGLVDLSNYE